MKLQLTPSFTLTTEHPASSYGLPVLANQNGDAYGPGDVAQFYPSHGPEPAGAFVVRCVKALPLDTEARRAVASWLRQWPDGPQLSADDKQVRRFSLVNVHKQTGNLVTGSWIQNHVGTLESARKVADETEALNSHHVPVAVVDQLPGGQWAECFEKERLA